MLVLALDTTTRHGSVALAHDGAIIDANVGDPAVTHGQRLPGDLTRLLDRRALHVRDIDLFAVAAGPGSFTGLRIGIATMQGLALANGRHIVGISALDALRHASGGEGGSGELAVWMDAHRGEVFSALYRGTSVVEGPTVEKPSDILQRWRGRYGDDRRPLKFAGDGALAYGHLIRAVLPGAGVPLEVPMLAPSIAVLAGEQAQKGETVPPDAIRPVYVRRPDAELARDRALER
ncbi:MAG: tRNA (adenosine(37)-N6)-threonylcarbamoyltransferase complex dimerization subunit type 1 TsaB [Vicinamibacterales bacterium]|nr:tRNA (adenosine(37)-N6)-threonylcarbamoyltransferase complex dimerization subunit type 1 TsaB [Vicinamibacterales bacterium]